MTTLLSPHRHATPAVFNPLTQVTALHAVWLGDPAWTNPGDGNPIDSLRNQSGGGDPASSGTNRPTFDAVNPAYNNRATAHFDAASSQRLGVEITDISQAYKLIVVGNLGNTGVAERLISPGLATAANGGIGDNNSGSFTFGSGSLVNDGASDHNPHVFRATLNGASSQLWIDEVSAATGNANTTGFRYFAIGAAATLTPAYSVFLNGDIAFVGVYDGATSDAALAQLCEDLASYYGTP